MHFLDSSRIGRAVVWRVWVLVAVVLVGQPGCESNDPPPPRTVDTSPQAKFERLVAALRRGLETGVDSGGVRYTFSDTAGAASTVFSYKVDAPEKINASPTPGELPRATIKITQRSSYSSLTSSKEDEDEGTESDSEKPKERRSGDQLSPDEKQSELEALGYEVLDPSLVDKDFADAASSRVRAPDFSTRTITTDTVVEYELVFENNRWRMAAPPAADTPESTNIAMDLALKRQQ
jgi:hypothetical protein